MMHLTGPDYNTIIAIIIMLRTGLVIVCHVTDAPLSDAQRVEMVRYLRNVQREDGGWGL